ncbi:hypothetical protein BRC81_10080 [Halobacteriales archaeon QS_1_68_20]|nr:MAG: hypothetical protein BRC81_10080 [Halobacteriales archaeon QS_1_68_20]
MDLFEHLAYKGFVCPNGIEIAVVLAYWVTGHERDLTAAIIERSVDDNAPLQHPGGDDDRICVTSVEAVDEHVREVEKDLY